MEVVFVVVVVVYVYAFVCVCVRACECVCVCVCVCACACVLNVSMLHDGWASSNQLSRYYTVAMASSMPCRQLSCINHWSPGVLKTTSLGISPLDSYCCVNNFLAFPHWTSAAV